MGEMPGFAVPNLDDALQMIRKLPPDALSERYARTILEERLPSEYLATLNDADLIAVRQASGRRVGTQSWKINRRK